MYDGSRVTDAVEYWRRRGELKGAVWVVRSRQPERFRWRRAIGSVSQDVGGLYGRERFRIEEPMRELVIDLHDRTLRREIVLDARRAGVDFDRGEVLPTRTLAEVRGLAEEASTNLSLVGRHTRLPEDPGALVDVAAVVVVSRALADHYRTRSQRLLLQVPDSDGPEEQRLHHRIMIERAAEDRRAAQNWGGFARTMLDAISYDISVES